MCEIAVEDKAEALDYDPDHLETQQMCKKAVEEEPYKLERVPDYFKMKKMRKRSVEKYPWALEYVPDWFVTCEQLNLWHDYTHGLYHNNDRFIKWRNSY